MERDSLKETVRVVNGGDDHLLISSNNEEHALDVARRIHEQSKRASLPIVVFDASVLLTKENESEMLSAFSEPPLSPLHSAGRGTLVIRNVELLAGDFQHVLSRIIDNGYPNPRPASSNLPYLEARVILIESEEETTDRSLRKLMPFIPLSRFNDDL